MIKLFAGLIFLLLFVGPLVIAQDEELKELELIIPTDLNENEEFTITVTSNGTSVKDAIVIYNDSVSERIYQTDSAGEITIFTPEISSDDGIISLNIFVAKNGFIANETIINITNLPNLFFKGKENSYDEYQAEPNESILITIIDAFETPVDNVQIEITDYYNTIMTYYTDSNGEVSFNVPDPEYGDGEYQIIASKTGYSMTEKYLRVYTPYADYSLIGIFVICPIIFFIIIAIIIIVIIYLFMKKKNNGNNKQNNGGEIK